MNGPALQLRGLSRSYGAATAVDGVDLELDPRSLTALVGPSGCGKSTLLEMIAGLTPPSVGTVAINGTDQSGVPAERRTVSLVFQKALLFPHLSVAGNVGFGLRMLGVPRAEREDRVAAILERVQLAGLGQRRTATLSGGQEQRVALARALVLDPTVLLLDEPFSQLDAPLRAEMRELVLELHDEGGFATLFVTHDQAEAVEIADRLGVMLDGSIVALDTPAQLFQQPPSLDVARFLGTGNEIAGVVRNGVFAAGPITVTADVADGPGVLTVRPEALAIGEGPVHAEVKSVRFVGTHHRVTLNADGITLVAHAGVAATLAAGDQVQVAIDADRCVVHPDSA